MATNQKHITIVIVAAAFLCCSSLPVRAWILVLNGTTSAGKTTLAKNLQKRMKQPVEYLQWDLEATQARKEMLAAIDYHHNEEPDFWGWADSLPEDVKKKINISALENAAATLAQKHIIEKAQKLNQARINVIVDTAFLDGSLCKILKAHEWLRCAYFVLVYAPIDQLLKNVIARNASNIKSEKRELLWPLSQYIRLFEPCDVTLPKKLDVLTKEKCENVFKQLEGLIDSKDQNDLKKVKTKTERTFFCGGKDVVGVSLKSPPHNFVINTATANPAECAEELYAWLAQLEPMLLNNGVAVEAAKNRA